MLHEIQHLFQCCSFYFILLFSTRKRASVPGSMFMGPTPHVEKVNLHVALLMMSMFLCVPPIVPTCNGSVCVSNCWNRCHRKRRRKKKILLFMAFMSNFQ